MRNKLYLIENVHGIRHFLSIVDPNDANTLVVSEDRQYTLDFLTSILPNARIVKVRRLSFDISDQAPKEARDAQVEAFSQCRRRCEFVCRLLDFPMTAHLFTRGGLPHFHIMFQHLRRLGAEPVYINPHKDSLSDEEMPLNAIGIDARHQLQRLAEAGQYKPTVLQDIYWRYLGMDPGVSPTSVSCLRWSDLAKKFKIGNRIRENAVLFVDDPIDAIEGVNVPASLQNIVPFFRSLLDRGTEIHIKPHPGVEHHTFSSTELNGRVTVLPGSMPVELIFDCYEQIYSLGSTAMLAEARGEKYMLPHSLTFHNDQYKQRYWKIMNRILENSKSEIRIVPIGTEDPNAKSSVISFRSIKKDSCVNPAVLSELKTAFDCRVFVETGTYRGDTTAVAAAIFPTVHTFELGDDLFQAAKARFDSIPKVTVHHQGSAEGLHSQLPRIEGRIFFWLDAHFSDEGTAKGSMNTPILDELDAIRRCSNQDSVILVDDLRFFSKKIRAVRHSDAVGGYPTAPELFIKLLQVNPNFQVYCIGDAVLAYPKRFGVSVTSLVKACTFSRLFDEANGAVTLDLALESEREIGEAVGDECLALMELPEIYAATEPYGLGAHYRLWRGLVHLKRNSPLEAQRDLVQAQQLGCDHFRIVYYLALAARKAGNLAEFTRLRGQLSQTAPEFTPKFE